MHLQVIEGFRRHGVGRALMEATVSWAEETVASHIVAAASATSRDANRFMARLGLTQMAVVRGSTARDAGQAARGDPGRRPGRQPHPPQRQPGAGAAPVDARSRPVPPEPPPDRLTTGPLPGVVPTRVADVSDQPAAAPDPSTAPPRLLLLDGHSLAYRAFFALPVDNFSTSTGQHTNAVYGFTSMLINVLRDEQPTHVGVAFDVSRKTFRSEEYVEYKANRPSRPTSSRSGLADQGGAGRAADHHHREGRLRGRRRDRHAGHPGARRGLRGADRTGDRDSFQLVSDRSTVLYPSRGVSEMARMTPEAVQEKYGVPPARYPEIAALVGETSDNLPGVPGVGPKTAAKWISQYDGLDNVINNADQIKGKAGDSFREHLGDVIRNRRLNALVCDLALTATPTDLAAQPWDRQEVHTLFDSLEFRVLRDRLFATLESEEEIDDSGFHLDATRLGAGELAGWLDAHATGASRVGVQVQGTWRAGSGDVFALALASGDGAAAWLDVEQISPEDDRVLAGWLADASVPKVLHDAKGPMLALTARGWRLAGLERDTALSAYLARPDQRSYDLADLTLRYLKRELKAEGPGDQGQLTFDSVGEDSTGDVAMLQARAVLDLAEALDTDLEERGGTRLLADVELPLVLVLTEMERLGVAVDVDRLESLESHFAGEVKRAADEAFAVIGKEINLGSPKQLQVVLFDELGMPKTKRTKTGYTTDADSLQALYVKTEHPFLLACCGTATSPGCGRPSRACSRRSPPTAASTPPSTS